MTNKKDNNEYEFQYLEFIRNPIINEEQRISKVNTHIKCVALDYFDYIYVKEVKNFEACMVSENDIPCEAYQSIGLFRKTDENDRENESPFELNTARPILAVLQITLTPESYSYCEKNDVNRFIDNSIEELKKVISASAEKYHEEKPELIYCSKIYQTVNTMDFCVVISTNGIEFPMLLSNEIKSLTVNNKKAKYSIYTVMGLARNLEDYSNLVLGENTSLVSRVHLNRQIFSKENKSDFIKNLKIENKEHKSANNHKKSNNVITDTHVLPGRYDLSIRINSKESELKSFLPVIVKYIDKTYKLVEYNSLNKKADNNFAKNCESNFDTNMLKWLFDKGFADYVNVRMLFGGDESLISDGSESNLEGTTSHRKHNKNIELEFTKLKSIIDESKYQYKLSNYVDKLHNIVHIYIALYSRYDTNLSIKMLGEYLLNFMELLEMYVHFAESDSNLASINDIVINFSLGIVYLQQFIKLVTSVNSSSFEAPKYEVEKDECSIVKLPIAYTEMINEVFKKYYNCRLLRNDDEFCYFPKYKPLVIPYMQNAKSSFIMNNLFAQNMSDNWDEIKKDWKNFNNNNNHALMYIICENMSQYKNVGDVIIATFHEVGHYCNGMTRKERNSDLISAFTEVIAKSIVKKFLSFSTMNYFIVYKALFSSKVISRLYKCVYDALKIDLEEQSKDYTDYPKAVFVSKLYNSVLDLTYPFSSYDDIGVSESFYDEMMNARFMFQLPTDFDQTLTISSTEIVFNDVLDNCNELNKQLKKNINDLKESSSTNSALQELWDSLFEYSEVLTKILNTKLDKKYNGGTEKDYIEVIELFKQMVDKYNKIRFENYDSFFIDMENEASDKYLFIKESLNNTVMYIKFCIGLINKKDYYETIKTHSQFFIDEKLTSINLRKKKLIENIENQFYLDSVDIYANKQSRIDDTLELFYELQLYPEGNKKEFINILNNAFKGVSISEDSISNKISAYDEAIADIIMCENLNLSLEEYIISILDVYDSSRENSIQTIERLVISTYFLYLKENAYFNKDLSNGDDLIETIKNHNDYFKRLASIMNNNKAVCITRIYKLIINGGEAVFDSKVLLTAIKRLFLIRNNLSFVEQNDYKFVKSFIRDKVNNLNSNKNETNKQTQNEKIQFILKYYYKNRFKYSQNSEE